MLFIRKMKTFLNLIPGVSRDTTISLSLAAFSFVIYLSNFRTIGSGDTVPASLLPIVLLTEGSIYFDSYAQHYEKNGDPAYFFHHTGGRTVSSYPLATGFLAAPIYTIPVLGWKIIHRPTIEEWISFAGVMEKAAAAGITSISIIVFFYTCRALNCQQVTAFWLSAVYAFGSEAWSTSSQGLWTHGPGISLMLLSTFLALIHVRASNVKSAVLLGLCCGTAVAVRLNNIFFAGPLLCWILWKRHRHFIPILVSTAVVVIPLVAYNRACYGTFTGAYGVDFTTPFLTGLEGSLFSPARGLFIYFPLTIFAITGFVNAFRKPDTAHRTIYLVFFLFIGASIVSVSKWAMWWGGFSYGPRLFAEVQPFLLLSSVPTCKTIFEQRQPKLGRLVFFLLFAWSSSTQALGAYVPSDWNFAPKSVDQAPGRVWDWADNPMSRSVHVIERFLASHFPGTNPSPSQPRP
jgi:hypothetical protein